MTAESGAHAPLAPPLTRVERIVAETTGIAADTALRLSKVHGTSAQLWLKLQNRYDMETAERALGKEFARTTRDARRGIDKTIFLGLLTLSSV